MPHAAKSPASITFIVLALVALALSGGCKGTGGIFSTAGDDMERFLSSPAVQTTLDNWSAKADMSNPRLSVVSGWIGEARMDGVIVRAEAIGNAHGGLDPVLYETLVKIAKENGYVPPPPATQPTPPAINLRSPDAGNPLSAESRPSPDSSAAGVATP